MACKLKMVENVRILDRLQYTKATRFYSAIDIAIYPRINSKVCRLIAPLKPLEAMAHKVPVVISKLPAIEELIFEENEPSKCIFIDPENVDGIYKAIYNLILKEDILNQLSHDGYNFIRMRRSWDSIIDKYIQ